MNRSEGDRQAQQHRAEDDENFSGVAGEQEVYEFADVGIDDPSLLDRRDDACIIVVGENHVRRLLGDIRPGDAHGDPDVRPLQGRSVVHAVTGHRHDVISRLQSIDDSRLVLG